VDPVGAADFASLGVEKTTDVLFVFGVEALKYQTNATAAITYATVAAVCFIHHPTVPPFRRDSSSR
jgi:hypothetical protein